MSTATSGERATGDRRTEIAAMNDWEPIETAPKDGRAILLYVPMDAASNSSEQHRKLLITSGEHPRIKAVIVRKLTATSSPRIRCTASGMP